MPFAPTSSADAALATGLPTGPLRWFLGTTSPAYQDEGAPVNVRVWAYNPVPGATIEIEITGALAGQDDWVENFHDVATAACEAAGCTYEQLTGNTRGRITLTADYISGAPIDITRTSRLDQITEGTQQMDCFIRNQSQGVIVRGVVSRWLYDVSLTPPGTPTFRHRSLTPGSGIDEGQSFTNRIETENLGGGSGAGMLFRIYSSNTANGQADWTEPFATEIRRAALAAGARISFRQNPGYDDGPDAGFETPGTGGLNGAVIMLTAAYDDAQPITYTRTALADQLTEAAQEQVDFLIDRITNAPANMITYSTVVSKWVRDTSRSPTPTYWQIEATPGQPGPGDIVTYRVFTETGVSAASVTIAPAGDATDADFTNGFHAALLAAADADSHVSYDGAGTLSVDAGWSGSFSWTRQVAGAFAGRRRHVVRLSGATSTSRIVVAEAVQFVGGVTLPAEIQFGTGVNEAGGEFGQATQIPGVYGNDYRYPARPEFNVLPAEWSAAGWDIDDYRHQELHYWWLKGATIVRLPVRWERIQRELLGPLYDGGFAGVWNGSSSSDMARIDDFIRYAEKRGILTIIDVHNYGRYRIPGVSSDLIAPDARPNCEDYYDLMRKLAARYIGRGVAINIMNEPAHSIPIEWARIARGAVQAIRSTGFLGRVMVPGVASTGAWSWVTSGNGDAQLTITDPADNMDHEGHQYLNADRSGAGSDAGFCTLNSGFQARAMVTWARENGRKMFLGEFGVSDPAVTGQEQCAVELPNMLQLLATSKDVCRGWTAWIGGQRANPTDHFKLDPANYLTGPDTPQGARLIPYFYNGGD